MSDFFRTMFKWQESHMGTKHANLNQNRNISLGSLLDVWKFLHILNFLPPWVAKTAAPGGVRSSWLSYTTNPTERSTAAIERSTNESGLEWPVETHRALAEQSASKSGLDLPEASLVVSLKFSESVWGSHRALDERKWFRMTCRNPPSARRAIGEQVWFRTPRG